MSSLTLIPGDSDDPYAQTLDHLVKASQQLHAAAVVHRTAAPLQERLDRSAALADLHHRVRSMAAVLNHALGGRPQPSEEPQ